jgi:hypothetical protein
MTAKKMAAPKSSQECQITSANATTGSVGASSARSIICDIQRTGSERLRVSIGEYRGRTNIDLRVWFTDESGVYKPSSKGVSIRPTHIAEVIQALMLAARAIDPNGGR